MTTTTAPETSTMTAWRFEPVTHNPAVYTDDGHLLLLLTASWELQTGRICPPWPLCDASAADLMKFWADPEMEADTTGEVTR